MALKLRRECGEGGLQKPRCTVGVVARAAAAYLSRPALEARQIARIGDSLRDPSGRGGQRSQSEEARPALRRALGREVLHDPRRLAYATARDWQESDYTAPQREPALSQHRGVERQIPSGCGVDPGAEVAT